MKRVAEDKPVVRVVEVADPVQIRLAIRTVPPDIARVTVALKGYMHDAIQTTTLRILSGLNRIWHDNALASCTKYLQFFEVSTCATLFETVIANILGVWILDSAAGSHDRQQIRLLPLSV